MTATLSPLGHVTSNPELYARRFDDFTARARRLAGSLSREHRATVASRPRFYSMPYLRPADFPDPDDLLP